MLQEMTAEIAREISLARERFGIIRGLAVPSIQEAVQKAEQAFLAAQDRNTAIIALAAQVSGSPTQEQRDRLMAMALVSKEQSQEARRLLVETTNLIVTYSEGIVRQVRTTAHARTTLLMGIVTVALIAGIALAILIGQVGIARPISRINAVLADIARGNFAVTAFGSQRRDEVGDIARAAETFAAMAWRPRACVPSRRGRKLPRPSASMRCDRSWPTALRPLSAVSSGACRRQQPR